MSSDAEAPTAPSLPTIPTSAPFPGPTMVSSEITPLREKYTCAILPPGS